MKTKASYVNDLQSSSTSNRVQSVDFNLPAMFFPFCTWTERVWAVNLRHFTWTTKQHQLNSQGLVFGWTTNVNKSCTFSSSVLGVQRHDLSSRLGPGGAHQTSDQQTRTSWSSATFLCSFQAGQRCWLSRSFDEKVDNLDQMSVSQKS